MFEFRNYGFLLLCILCHVPLILCSHNHMSQQDRDHTKSHFNIKWLSWRMFQPQHTSITRWATGFFMPHLQRTEKFIVRANGE